MSQVFYFNICEIKARYESRLTEFREIRKRNSWFRRDLRELRGKRPLSAKDISTMRDSMDDLGFLEQERVLASHNSGDEGPKLLHSLSKLRHEIRTYLCTVAKVSGKS